MNQITDGTAETFLLVVLHSEGLDDLLAGQRLLQQLGEPGQILLALVADAPHPPAQARRQPQHCRRHEQRPQGQLPVDVEDQSQEEQQEEHLAQKVGQGLAGRLQQTFRVVEHPRHELSGGLIREEGGGLVKQASVETIPQLGHRALSTVAHEIFGKIEEQGLEDGQPDQEKSDLAEAASADAQVFLQKSKLGMDLFNLSGDGCQLVENRLQQHRDETVQTAADEQQNEAQEQPMGRRQDVGNQLSQVRHAGILTENSPRQRPGVRRCSSLTSPMKLLKLHAKHYRSLLDQTIEMNDFNLFITTSSRTSDRR